MAPRILASARALLLLAFACSCGPGSAPRVTPAAPEVAKPGTSVSAPPEIDAELPPPARAIAASELAKDSVCGPFRTADLAATDQPLLEDRVRVRFLPNGKPSGGAASGKLETQREGATLFIGAREMFSRGDAQFERRAAKTGTFGGKYEAVSIPTGDAKLTVVAGVLRDLEGDHEMVSVAHGWFLDPNRDVLDVAVFVSASALKDLPQCRLFAEKLLSTVAQGPRMLKYGAGAEVDAASSRRGSPSCSWRSIHIPATGSLRAWNRDSARGSYSDCPSAGI